MKPLLILILLIIVSTLLFTANAATTSNIGSSNSNIYPQSTSKAIKLREDLPSYVFEYDLERLYPATWEFYKKLDIIKRDKVYSHYLYHPAIKDVRHRIFKLALGADKGKTTPAPTSFNQVFIANKNTDKKEQTMKSSQSTLGSFNLSSVNSITDSPTIRTVQFNTNSNQSVYSFLKYQ